MAIETTAAYVPKFQLPMYTMIRDPRFNDYRVGDKYDIRIEDEERQEEKGGSGPYSYIHQALLVGKQEYEYGMLPDVLMAFDAHTKSRKDAREFICPGDDCDEDRTFVVLFFVRLDKIPEWIQGEAERINPREGKEPCEGNTEELSTKYR